MNAKDKLLSKLGRNHSHETTTATHAPHSNTTLGSSTHTVKPGKQQSWHLILAVVILVIGIATVAFFVLNNSNPSTQTPIQMTNNASVILLKDAQCDKCFKLDPLVAQAFPNLNSTSVQVTSSEGQQLVAKYGIEKVPVVIVVNYQALDEVTKSALQSVAVTKGDDMVLYSPAPPYIQLSTGQIVGVISLTIVKDSTCVDCYDIEAVKNQLTSQGMTISNYQLLEANSTEAKEITDKYKLDFAPFMVFSKDLSAYTSIAQAWQTIGTIAQDGAYVQTIPQPPYVNLTTGQIRGLVDLTYLNDSTCTQCYDVTVHKRALVQPPLNLKIKNEKTVDVSSAEGKALIAKYGITQVPTVLVSSEAAVYKLFVQVWPQVGTQATDGTFIISNLSKLSGITFKDLTNGNVTTTPAAQPQAQ